MNLIKSTGTFSFFTIISRLLGYLRDILIAIFLGTGVLADAFFVAFRVPSYSSELSQGKEKADLFADNVLNILFICLFIIVILIELLMPYFVFLIAPGFDGQTEKMNLAVNLTRITFPFLIFASLASFFSAILNSHNRFAVASAAPIILNILLIGILFFANYLNDSLVYYLSYAVTISGLIQLVFLFYFVKKFYTPNFNFKFTINEKVKFFFRKLLPSIFSSGVTQINILIGTIIASFQSSAVSYLYYADRIYQINLAIAGIAIGTVILPQLSKYIQNDLKSEINLIQNKALELSLFLSLPAMVALMIASDEIVSALFGYGSFSEESVTNSAKALFFFSLGLPAFSLIKVFSSFFFAYHNTKIPFYISLISVIINISISVIYFSSIGFIIIPIATSISAWLNSILLFIFLKKENLFSFNEIFFKKIIKIIFASLIMGLFFNLLINFFSLNLDYTENFKSIYLILIVLFALILYILVSIFIKAFQIKDINLKY